MPNTRALIDAHTEADSRAAELPSGGRAKALQRRQTEQRVRDALRTAIGPHRFGLWFDNGTAVSVREGAIEVRAANTYVSDWINRHFREALESAAAQAFGAPGEVIVSVSEAGEVEATAASADTAAAARGAERRRRTDAGADVAPEAHQQPSPRAARTSAAADGTAARPSRTQSFRRLEDFVVGESNRLGFAASEQFGDGSAEAPSILFIHGECGVGKTHLIQGICRRRLERAPRQVIRYVTAEQFTNEYIASVRAGTLDEFRKRLRRVDLLAIDDIHFFANKTATQAEFLHTIDAIDLTGARIALVSDEHPRHIRRFSQSLVSRFLSGMVVKIDRPDRATRIELVRRLARDRGLDLTTAAEDAVAGRCAGSIREVEGAITRLGALVELDGLRGQIGPGTVERLLGDEAAVSAGSQPIRLGKIVDGVCERLRVNREDLLGSGRHARTVIARGMVAHLARELTTHSYPEIARALGRDTHSAVHTAAKRLRAMIDGDERIAAGGESIREVVDQLRHDLARNGRDR
jgi:chromosomal replication initiator protein